MTCTEQSLKKTEDYFSTLGKIYAVKCYISVQNLKEVTESLES